MGLTSEVSFLISMIHDESKSIFLFSFLNILEQVHVVILHGPKSGLQNLMLGLLVLSTGFPQTEQQSIYNCPLVDAYFERSNFWLFGLAVSSACTSRHVYLLAKTVLVGSHQALQNTRVSTRAARHACHSAYRACYDNFKY